MENAHNQLVRDIDFNPNKQYYLASCGDDCKTKVNSTLLKQNHRRLS